MIRVLVRSGKDPLVPVNAEASLARNGWGVFGANVGNALFSGSVHRALSGPGREVVSNSLLTELGGVDDAYVARINAEFDFFAIPLANAFRGSFVPSLRRLTSVIQRLTIPVAVIGVGGQARLGDGGMPDEVRTATTAFMKAVLDRSASVGIRGEHTRSMLAELGFGDEHVRVIGCPSLYDLPADHRVEKGRPALDPSSRIALNLTPSVTRMAPVVERDLGRFENLVYFPQEHTDLALLMWAEDAGGDPRMPVRASHRLFREDRAEFYLDASTWVGALAEYDFAYGTRIHGNIAALMAGTPAHVVVHDSRTAELAEFHRIPATAISDLPEHGGASELYAASDFAQFNAAHPRNLENYMDFLDENAVPHSMRSPDVLATYDQKRAAVDFPAPVRFVAPDGGVRTEDVVARLRWLRQGSQADQNRRIGAYRPPFGYSVKVRPTVTDLVERIEELQAELAGLRTEVAAGDSALSGLKREVRGQAATVASWKRVWESGLLTGVRRIVRRLRRARIR